ncbi:hypothetical protein [Erythrobacter sp. MTPC3]|uniref:hypothetical protein n=1 Tax=Erythrobacter sp. MTPC3 TaxID=3056564 RepID=UPI0036F3B39B
MLLVAVIGQEGGPLSKMSNAADAEEPGFVAKNDADSDGERVDSDRNDTSTELAEGWADEPIDPMKDIPDFDKPATFAEAKIQEYGSSSPASTIAKSRKTVATRAQRTRSANYDRSLVPDGYVDLNFNPQLH